MRDYLLEDSADNRQISARFVLPDFRYMNPGRCVLKKPFCFPPEVLQYNCRIISAGNRANLLVFSEGFNSNDDRITLASNRNGVSELNSSALVSTAMINALWSQNRQDTFDLFLPFIRYSIGKTVRVGEAVDTNRLSRTLENELGYNTIPVAVVDILLRRLSPGCLKRRNNQYYLIANLETEISAFERQRNSFKEHRDHVAGKLANYLNDCYGYEKYSEESATEALLSFFKANGICVIRKTDALEVLERREDREKYHIAQFVLREHRNESRAFDHILDMVKGFLVSAAVSFQPSNMSIAKMKFKNTCCYLDTRTLLNALGLHSDEEKESALQLIGMLKEQKATIACFEHTVNEIEEIINAYMRALLNPTKESYRGFRTLEGWDKARIKPNEIEAYLLVLDRKIEGLGVDIVEKPSVGRRRRYLINKKSLSDLLDKKINYSNKNALRNDVDSISSVILLREGFLSPSIEKCRHLFISPNRLLVKTAAYFFKDETGNNTPALISDVDLSAILWLKSCSTHKDYPKIKLIENALLSSAPSQAVLEAFYCAVDRAVNEGGISEEEAIILRSGLFQKRELMELVGGNADAVNGDSVYAIRDKIKGHYLEESYKLDSNTRKELEKERLRNAEALKNATDSISATGKKAEKVAKLICKAIAFILLGTLLIYGLYLSYQGISERSILGAGGFVVIVLDCIAFYDIWRERKKWLSKLIDRIVDRFVDWAKDKKRSEYRDIFGDSFIEV